MWPNVMRRGLTAAVKSELAASWLGVGHGTVVVIRAFTDMYGVGPVVSRLEDSYVDCGKDSLSI